MKSFAHSSHPAFSRPLGTTLLGLLAALAASSAGAQTTYTNNPVTTGSWSTGAGWDATPVSSVDTTLQYGTSTTASVSGTITSTNDLTGNFLLNQLVISKLNNGTNGVLIINGNPLEFANSTSGTGPVIDPSQNGNLQIELRNNIVLDTTLTIKGLGSGAFYLGGDYTKTGYTPGVISGAGGLSVGANGGNLRITGLNTYSGGTTVAGGTVSLLRSSVGSPGALTAGALGTGTVTFTGTASIDTFANQGDMTIGNALALNAANGTLNIGGGASLKGSYFLNGAISLGSNYTLAAATTSGKQIVVNGAISQSGGTRTLAITNNVSSQANAETVILNADNTYGGATTVNAISTTTGTLVVLFNGANSTSGVTLGSSGANKATVGGIGSLNALSIGSVGGTVAPGTVDASGVSQIGTLSLGTVNASAAGTNATFAFQLAAPGASDRIAITGSTGYNVGSANLSVSLAGFTGAAGDWYLLFHDLNALGSATGSFNGLGNGAQFVVDGITFAIYYGADFDGSGNFVSSTGGNDIALQVVPEPTTMLLLGGSLLLLVTFRRLGRPTRA